MRQYTVMRVLLILVTVLGGSFAADSLDSAGRPAVEQDRTPGLSLAVVRGGRIVRTAAYGYANLEWQSPVTVDTKFEIASISKMFAGAAARILIEEGRLDLEDPIAKYFDGTPTAWRGIRVWHLVTMSSGLPEDFASDLIPYNADVITPNDDASMLRAFFGLKMAAGV